MSPSTSACGSRNSEPGGVTKRGIVNLALIETLAVTEAQQVWARDTFRWAAALLDRHRLDEEPLGLLLLQDIMATYLLLWRLGDKAQAGDWRAVGPAHRCAERLRRLSAALQRLLLAQAVSPDDFAPRLRSMLARVSQTMDGVSSQRGAETRAQIRT